MRYAGDTRLNFVDFDQNNYTLIEPQEISQDGIFQSQIEIGTGDELDALAVRPDVYGQNNEDLYFNILDYNATVIAENGYKIAGLKTLRIKRP